MKKLIFVSLLAVLFSTNTFATNDPQVLGDHFSLEAALEVFKNSQSPEDFENNLNNADSKVNNLDLNEDGEVDYIRVIDEVEEDAHAIILQAVLSENEAQDVAVIAIERTGENEATLQIFGDKALYGKGIIVEPFEVESSQSVDGYGPDGTLEFRRIFVNVWFWNPVRFIYRPVYRPWRSPFYWGYYPTIYRPWRPVTFGIYSSRVAVFRPRFRVVTAPRVVTARRIYAPRRTTSVMVRNRAASNRSAVGRSARANRATTNRNIKNNRKSTQRKRARKAKRGRKN